MNGLSVSVREAITLVEAIDAVDKSLRVLSWGVYCIIPKQLEFIPYNPCPACLRHPAGGFGKGALARGKYILNENISSRTSSALQLLSIKDGIMADHLPPAHAPPLTKLTVLISGSGTNLQALIDASTTGLLPSTSIIRVISNKKGVQGSIRAEKAGIPTAYHNLISGKYLKSGEKDPNVIKKARDAYDADLAGLVLKDKPDLVVCVSGS